MSLPTKLYEGREALHYRIGIRKNGANWQNIIGQEFVSGHRRSF